VPNHLNGQKRERLPDLAGITLGRHLAQPVCRNWAILDARVGVGPYCVRTAQRCWLIHDGGDMRVMVRSRIVIGAIAVLAIAGCTSHGDNNTSLASPANAPVSSSAGAVSPAASSPSVVGSSLSPAEPISSGPATSGAITPPSTTAPTASATPGSTSATSTPPTKPTATSKSTPKPTSTPTAKPAPKPQPTKKAPVVVGSRWIPAPGLPWQWELDHPITTAEIALPVAAFDVDGFDTPASTVAAIHARGARAICYIDVGTAENWRSDYAKFPASVMGADNGWPGEKWLDVRQLSVLEPIMEARFAMCKAKGFDAVEPDNVDSYENDPGFPTTAKDQLTFNIWVAKAVHALGMSVAQKNDDDQAAQLVSYFDFVVVEQCAQYSECDSFEPYTAAHKAVLDVEYSGGTGFCAGLPAGVSGMAKDLNLDAKRTAC
jgi:hypothetical protein